MLTQFSVLENVFRLSHNIMSTTCSGENWTRTLAAVTLLQASLNLVRVYIVTISRGLLWEIIAWSFRNCVRVTGGMVVISPLDGGNFLPPSSH
jgi:hypothetical protein